MVGLRIFRKIEYAYDTFCTQTWTHPETERVKARKGVAEWWKELLGSMQLLWYTILETFYFLCYCFS